MPGRPSRCSGCGAGILFVKMLSGKSMPCETEIEGYFVVPTRAQALDQRQPAVVLIGTDGKVRRGYVTDPMTPGAMRIEGYPTHWAACPASDRFRRPMPQKPSAALEPEPEET